MAKRNETPAAWLLVLTLLFGAALAAALLLPSRIALDDLSANAAAWVQAVGSVAAIFTAVLVPYAERLRGARERSVAEELRVAALERGVITELRDVGVRLAIATFRVDEVLGRFGRHSVARMHETYTKLGQGEQNAEAIKLHETMLSWTDQEFAAVALARPVKTHKAGGGIGLRNERMPFVDAKIAELDSLGQERMAQLLGIRSQLEQYNEMVEDCRRWMRLTFELPAGGGQAQRASENLGVGYDSVGRKADNVRKRIIAFIEKRPPSTPSESTD
jgi:hypothetical protein